MRKVPEQEVRLRIIEGTIEEFNDKGFKFTMDDIAKRISISKKTIYAVFNDKEDLFMQMVDYCFGEIKESERAIVEDDQMDVIEKLRRVLVVLPDRYSHIDFRQIYEMKDKYPAIFKKINHRLETEWEPTIQLLEQAISEGKMKPLPIPVVKIMVETSIERFLSSKTLIESKITYKEALADMAEIILEGMLVR